MEIYVVRGGDSLYGIARRYGTDAAELARINQLNDPARLVPGMALLVPGGTADRRAAWPLPTTAATTRCVLPRRRQRCWRATA